jgi:hypothetical protein
VKTTRIQFDGREVDFESFDCDYCKDTGKHLCPDVTEPILVNCSSKVCKTKWVDISECDLDEEEQ